MLKKNEELLLELEEERSQKVSVESPKKHSKHELGEEIERIVGRLAEELRHEREVRKKYYGEMKDLSKELNESEKVIQRKNEIIYHLELQLLKGERNSLAGQRSPLRSRDSRKR